MSNKITWKMVYKDFKQRFPHLSKEVIHWQPYDFATIKLWINDGTKMLYNYDTHKTTFIEE